MSIDLSPWGSANGENVHLYTITNNVGVSLVLTNFGATVVQMNMPSPDGVFADVVLGFDTLSDYQATPTYFSATVGRFGNRIRLGKFELDGQQHQVTCNEGENSLHGGVSRDLPARHESTKG